MTLAQRLNELLASKNVKQKELAKALNVLDNTVSYFCSGKRTPNTEQICNIAKFFNVSTDYLLGLTDAQTTDKDIQFICDYTGQSEEVIEFLVFLKKMGGCNLIDLFKNELVVNWVHQNFEKR